MISIRERIMTMSHVEQSSADGSHQRLYPVFFLVILMFLLAGCQSETVPDTKFFPLTEGLHWEYQVTEERADEQKTSVFTVENRGMADFRWPENDPAPVYQRRTSDGTDYYFTVDELGIHRIARRTLIEYQPLFDSEPRMVLPADPSLDRSVQWNLDTQPYLLKPSMMLNASDSTRQHFSMVYDIVADQAEVRVPAGHFRQVIKVVGQHTLRFYADPRTGYAEVNITQTEWYAPGVGLVKLVRDEPVNLAFFKGGRITFELARFTR